MLNSNGRYYRFSKALVFDFSKSTKKKTSALEKPLSKPSE